MFKLIQNELIKIFSKVSTYIMLGILLILIVGVAALMEVTVTVVIPIRSRICGPNWNI